jgi:hypothetical protein
MVCFGNKREIKSIQDPVFRECLAMLTNPDVESTDITEKHPTKILTIAISTAINLGAIAETDRDGRSHRSRVAHRTTWKYATHEPD